MITEGLSDEMTPFLYCGTFIFDPDSLIFDPSKSIEPINAPVGRGDGIFETELCLLVGKLVKTCFNAFNMFLVAPFSCFHNS